jgi:transcriptional regulator of arginine metabolism
MTMKERELRQREIRSLVRTYAIKRQADLVDRLKAKGFDCTQATVSRDINDMGLKKLPRGGYVLAEDLHLQRMVKDLVVSIVSVGNLLLVKAQAGTAPGVAAALDDAKLVDVLGSVSGDDTILVVCGDDATAKSIHDTLGMYQGG